MSSKIRFATFVSECMARKTPRRDALLRFQAVQENQGKLLTIRAEECRDACAWAQAEIDALDGEERKA